MLSKSVFGIICILSLSAVTYGNGDCNEADQNDTIKRDSPAFVKNWHHCGRKSLGMAASFNKCLQEKHINISLTCINCFGEFVGCTRSNCLFSCIGFSDKWCERCALESCEAPLVTCTGVSKEMLPSKYPKTAIVED